MTLMFRAVHAWLKRHIPFLFEEKMPVWLTLLASLAAAWATYVFAPTYTRRFQVEDVRSQHLTGTTNNLNEEIVELSQNIRRFRTALARNDVKEAVKLREQCLDDIVKLQWRLVDLRVILTESNDEALVTGLSNALEKLRVSLEAPVTPEYQPRIRASMDELAKRTRDVLNRLYGKSALQG